MLRALLAALALTACATAPAPAAVNALATGALNPWPNVAVGADGEVIALALSGGGARAASFSLGAMQELRDTRAADGRALIDHVALVTSVSGGSIAAAYFGVHGPAGLDTFRAAYLDKDWHAALNTSPVSPLNWMRAWRGGINSSADLSGWLDAEIFQGARMGALWRGGAPQVWLNAVDLYHGVPFTFTPVTFDALCSELAQVRVADAVAASMAVPVVFAPILIEPRRDHCMPMPHWTETPPRTAPALVRASAEALRSYRAEDGLPYLHLVDGGVVDNLGLSAFTLARLTAANAYAPFSAEGGVRLRRFTMLVVNAETLRDADWQTRAAPPPGAAVLDTSYDVAVQAANRASFDAFAAVAADWREALIAWRCGLSPERRLELRAPAEWNCADVTISVDMVGFADLPEPERHQLGVVATRVSLPAAEIDALIAGGRAVVRASPAVAALRN